MLIITPLTRNIDRRSKQREKRFTLSTNSSSSPTPIIWLPHICRTKRNASCSNHRSLLSSSKRASICATGFSSSISASPSHRSSKRWSRRSMDTQRLRCRCRRLEHQNTTFATCCSRQNKLTIPFRTNDSLCIRRSPTRYRLTVAFLSSDGSSWTCSVSRRECTKRTTWSVRTWSTAQIQTRSRSCCLTVLTLAGDRAPLPRRWVSRSNFLNEN